MSSRSRPDNNNLSMIHILNYKKTKKLTFFIGISFFFARSFLETLYSNTISPAPESTSALPEFTSTSTASSADRTQISHLLLASPKISPALHTPLKKSASAHSLPSAKIQYPLSFQLSSLISKFPS